MTENKYKVIIKACWVVLAVCLIVKLFGGNYFSIACDNIYFTKLCSFVDNHLWVKMTIACIMYVFSTYFVLCIELKEPHWKLIHWCVFLPIMIAKNILTWYYPYIAFAIDCILLLLLPLPFNKNFKRNLITFLAICLFQVVTLIFKNIGVHIGNFNSTSFLIEAISQIDYYIMILLYYLYTFKKGVIK